MNKILKPKVKSRINSLFIWWMSSLTCENCLHNKYFPPVTFLVRNSPASDPRSECRAGFQDKFHLTPDSEERSKARKRERAREPL